MIKRKRQGTGEDSQSHSYLPRGTAGGTGGARAGAGGPGPTSGSPAGPGPLVVPHVNCL